MDAVAEARGVVRRFRAGGGVVEALRGVDLAVARGELLAVTGASGSGKSTLLQLLGCLDRPSAGTCLFEGGDVSRLGDRELSRLRLRRVGFVFQAAHLVAHLTLGENVALPLRYRGTGAPAARRRAAEALERVGLAGRARHRPRELSGGELQRGAIARAVVGEPALLLADEPTGNLDAAAGAAVIGLFRELNREGTTVVVASHDPAVASACDRRVRLADGRLGDGTVR